MCYQLSGNSKFSMGFCLHMYMYVTTGTISIWTFFSLVTSLFIIVTLGKKFERHLGLRTVVGCRCYVLMTNCLRDLKMS